MRSNQYPARYPYDSNHPPSLLAGLALCAMRSAVALGFTSCLISFGGGCRSGMQAAAPAKAVSDSPSQFRTAVWSKPAIPADEQGRSQESSPRMVNRVSYELPGHELPEYELPEYEPAHGQAPVRLASPHGLEEPASSLVARLALRQDGGEGQQLSQDEMEALPRPPTTGAEPVEPPTSDTVELSLNVAIAQTLARDPVLRAGFQDIAAANADFVTASLKPNPELEIMQSLLPLVRPFREGINEGGPPQFDVLLAYPIDWYLFGKRAAAMRSAAAEVRVSRAEYEDLVRLRVLEVAEAYYDVMEAQAFVTLTQQDAENLTTVEQVTQVAVENGALPRVELSRIRLDRLNSEQALREARRDLRTAKANLRAVMGGYIPGANRPDRVGPVEADFQVADLVTGVDDPDHQDPTLLELLADLDRVFDVAMVNRPDILALNLRIAQTRAEMELQRREAYPEITPMIGYTRQFQQVAIGQPDADSWGAGLAMTLPVNDRNQGNRLLAAAQFRQSNQQLQAGVLDLQAEVLSVAADLETALVNSRAIADDQLRLAEDVRDSIRRAYEAGGRPLIDVLDSQRNYRETFGNYISSRANYLRAVQRFNATVGTQLIH
jgi:outer membrane protein, heavy metal efflux system